MGAMIPYPYCSKPGLYSGNGWFSGPVVPASFSFSSDLFVLLSPVSGGAVVRNVDYH
jgi:hypothetical protein